MQGVIQPRAISRARQTPLLDAGVRRMGYHYHGASTMDKKERTRLIERFASGLKYPYLFLLVAVVFLLDLIVPDAIPFVDEILLGLVAVLLGTWKERKGVELKPPMKNITPDR